MVGIAQRVERGPVVAIDELKQRYHNLLHDDDFEGAIETSTTAAFNVRARLRLAIEAFKDVQ